MRILIVDDSNLQRKKIASYLRPLTVEVQEAVDGVCALEELDRLGPVDLLITDWNMPRMDGLALVKAVRAQTRYRSMKIMMVTTENEPWSVMRAIRSGADEYLMKPFDRDAILEKLRAVFGSEHPVFGAQQGGVSRGGLRLPPSARLCHDSARPYRGWLAHFSAQSV